MSCPDCGIKFMEFRAGTRLGCPQDYWVFSKGLMPLLQRYHGATRHIGKTARRREGTKDRLRMRTRLREAIAREEYEEAARLRDLLRHRDPHA
jgi:protein arginine kinase activator